MCLAIYRIKLFLEGIKNSKKYGNNLDQGTLPTLSQQNQ